MKAHYLVIVLSTALLGCSSTPQQQTLLKSDPYWVTGELDNGLTYHVYPDREQPVSVRLLVHAGSFQESEQQKGYAHFVEHMAFNGSKNFSGNDVVELFEQSGASFGADLNAYTSYQETLYKLDLPDNKNLDKALAWFRDIGDGLLLSETETKKEKGVILGEFRHSRVKDKPLSFQFYNHMVDGTNYQSHDPMGNKKSVSNVSAKELENFYQTWYQPQLTEVIVSGDITLAEVIPLIEKSFSSWQRGTTPVPVKKLSTNYNTQDFVAYVAGSESPSIGIVIDRGERVTHSHEQQHQLWLDEIAQQLIQQRLNSDFVDAALPVQWVASIPYLLEYQRYSITTVGFPADSREQSQQQFISTLSSLRDHGVSENEFMSVIQAYQANLDDIQVNWEKMDAVDHANGKSTALVINQTVQSQLDYKSSLKEFLSSTDLKAVNDNLDDLLSSPYILGLGLSSKEDLQAMNDELKDVRRAYKKTGNKPLLVTASSAFSVPASQGKIVKQVQVSDDPNLKQWTLSNGIEVWYLRNSEAGNNVGVYYASEGGKAALDPSLFPAVEIALQASIRSGVGKFSGSELTAHLRREDIEIYPFINFTHHGLEISAKKKTLAEGLAALHTIVTEPKIDSDQLEAVKSEFAQSRTAYLETPVGQFIQMVNRNSYQTSSRHMMLESDDIKAVTSQDILNVQHQLFQKLRDNTLVIVADINPAEIKPLVRQYVASLPLEAVVSPDYKVAYSTDSKERMDISINNEDSSQYLLRVISQQARDKTAKDVFMDDMLQRVLSSRLTAYVREELGLDYAPYVYSVAQDSEPSYDWLIGSLTAPENSDKIEQAIDKVIVEAAKGISEDETRTAAKQLVADLTPLQTKPTEQAWFISRYLIHDYGVEALFDLQRMTDSISSKDMTEYAKEIFGDNSYKLKNLLRPQS
ncbi:M16 family metallopeptidase [Vibrio kanaloae]|uniref:M16 family metallopeptidase n=1 Tax=Vibrio kanaloae TaxID=170673 RepID=UPI0010BDC683|nr:M16 family metallopeptidase [Vibrio kanaloae]TKF05069.1 insulinase family protein [Vibrio kanaloae]TKF63969.1 insulinase family protein [Vibrio kanaloae]